MAQAPQGPSGAPRQNKTVKEFSGMNTQNRRNAIPEGSFAWLENIQPIGPGHLHSIPGRGEALVRIPPEEPPPPGCTDSTLRGQAGVTIEDRFDQFNSFPPFSNLHTSWGYITSSEEVWTLIGNASGSGGNMAYDTTDCQINHWQSNVIVSHPALIDPDPLLPFVNTTVGNSDVPIYGCRASDTSFKCYYPDASTSVTYTLPVGLLSTTASGEDGFCKKGTSIYFAAHENGPNITHIVEYTVTSGAQLNDFDLGDHFPVSVICATTLHFYVLGFVFGDSNSWQLRKYLRSNGSLVATFYLDNISPFALGPVSDNLIYLLCQGNPAAFYYIENFTDLVYIGNTTGQGFAPLGNATGMFVNGALYYGGNGQGGFSPDIFKTSIACPEGSPATPVIASITRGSASVAAGANIVVSWTDVRIPVANDHIWLLPAPTPPNLGIIFANLIISRITDGLGTSSMNFLIPLATPPGTYILAFMANDLIYVEKTATFTVT